MNAHPPSYFSSLNYTLANEDNLCEANLVEALGAKDLLCISGSGSRALSLLNSRVESCQIVDFSQDQLDLCKLRELSLRHLSYEEFLGFWGYVPFFDLSSEAREDIFSKIPLDQVPSKLKNTLEYLEWPPLIYQGKWEKTFATFSKVIRFILGEGTLLPLLRKQSLTDQKAYFDIHLKGWKWDFLFKLLGNASLFNALLYKGHFVKKNHPLSHFEYYKNAFERIFERTLIRENFFAQLCFFGEIKTREANLPEASQKKFYEMKEWLKNKSPHYFQGDFFECLKKNIAPKTLDYISLSDVPSYFSGTVEKEFMQWIKPFLKPGAHVVLRHYLRKPENMNLVGFGDVSADYQRFFWDEKVQMYDCEVYQFLG